MIEFLLDGSHRIFGVSVALSIERKRHFSLHSLLGAVHILRNTLWGGGGLPDLLQYYMGGGLPNLLQYYIGGVFKIHYNITVLKGKWKVIILVQL